MGHTCNVVGNRQMLSVGGSQFLYPDLAHTNTTDPFKQGLGIFDMTELSWSDRYDADAKPYESTQVVRERYQRKGRTPDNGWDEDIQHYFNPSSNTTASPTASPSSSPKHHPSSHTGAIAGGVIGGAALVALLIAAVWFRHRQRQRRLDSSQEEPLESELDAKGAFVSQGQYELNASPGRYELDPLKRHEVPGSEAPRHELDSGRAGLGR